MKKKKDDDIKMFMKYDVGKGGFEGMITVLAIAAVVVLLVGLYFLFKILLPSLHGM